MAKENKVEIARSFSYKLAVPKENKFDNGESRDFFCSQKAEVPESEAVKTSEALYLFCKSEVIKSVNEYKNEMSQGNELIQKEEGTDDINEKIKNIPNWKRAKAKEWDLRNMKSDVETEDAESNIVGQQFREGNK